MHSICVFCGSSPGARAEFALTARTVGRTLAERGIRLVYGGASVGLMGQVADAALQAGGAVVGVIPVALADRELAHAGLTELHTVETMHERKARMSELADAFVALPGGYGTLDELFEVVTWAQLGLHAKPVGVLNVAGFFDPLLAMLDRAVAERFVNATHRQLVVVADEVPALFERLRRDGPAPVPKWMDLDVR